MPDLLVLGGDVVTPDGVRSLDVVVDGERISRLAPHGTMGTEADEVIDATGCIVIPGGVDPHVHYSLGFGPVHGETQDWSPAAAWGGTTTIIDFALQGGAGLLHDAIAQKQAEAAGRMAVDYAFHALLTENPTFEVLEEIGDVIRSGIPTIKVMTTYGWISDDGHIWGIFNEVAANGGLAISHAEDDAIANWLTARHLREGKTHGAYIADTRPSIVEEAAVRRMILLAERSGAPLYVFHVAAGMAAAAIGEARGRGVPIYGETIAAYLSFTQDKLWDDESRGLLWNNYPVIKTQADQDALWAAVTDDTLQVVSSDHFCTTASDRYDLMGVTVDSLQAGQTAVEMRLPVVYSMGVAEGRISLERFVELVSTNPARIMGLYPRKGAIAEGSDADLVVIDPNGRWQVTASEHHMSSDYNCWEGWELKGRVTATVLRGQQLVRAGAWVGPKASGRFLTRTLAPEVAGANPDLTYTSRSSG
jgi:dihydropyrimidinase